MTNRLAFGLLVATLAMSACGSGARSLTKVPDVVGKKAPDARVRLDAAGFTVRVVRATTDPSPPGTVFAEQPARASRGSVITLSVAEPPRSTRSCGYFPVGIGWYLWASKSVRCGAAKRFGRDYFSRRRALVTAGYMCSDTYLRHGERIRCTRHAAEIVVQSEGY